MSTPAAERLSVHITGRVQGVGFRHFTRTKAEALGLAGWVRNENDGSVRLEVEGPPGALDDLVEALREGPRAARVEDVSADRRDADGEFDGFQVRH